MDEMISGICIKIIQEAGEGGGMYRWNKPDHQWVIVEVGDGYMGVYLHYTLLLWGIFEIFYTKRFLFF